jgi:two-component system, cell cycle response regulator
MTAQILVVDDVPANVKLLEAKLSSEYYDVITAKDGFEAIKKAKEHKPDIILLDVMMPGIDGFEVCKKLKEDYDVSHIPIVMVTALSDKADRIKGLEAGADDFITKPINDVALFARIKSLVRIKMLMDEVRLRDKTSIEMGIKDEAMNTLISDVSGSRVLLVDDDMVQGKQIVSKLESTYQVEWISDPEQALARASQGNFDVILISTLLTNSDGLRLASHIKSHEEMRTVPLLVLVDDEPHIMLKALEMGINDYMNVPIDKNEMLVRVRTQIRRKKYQEALKSQYQMSISMAITDALTGLYNRHYLNTHLANMVKQAHKNGKDLALMIMDMDHFKMVNDTYGHDVGDMILKQLAKIIINRSRSAELAARFGGEEFIVLMPETDAQSAIIAAKRMCESVETTPFTINTAGEIIHKTVSIGVSSLHPDGDSAESLLKRADEALYEAKRSGRNRIVFSATLAPKGW